MEWILAQHNLLTMKIIRLVPALLMVGCMTTPKDVYVSPERYQCDLIIPTVWDGNHPVQHFEHELVVGMTYHDHLGMRYKLVPTETPSVFALQIEVDKP